MMAKQKPDMATLAAAFAGTVSGGFLMAAVLAWLR